MAPGGGLGFLRIQAQMVHLIGDRQPAAGGAPEPLAFKEPSMAGGALVAQQQSIPGRIAPIRSLAVAPHPLPVEQPQPKSVRRLVPLQADLGAVAEHHEPLQTAFALQLAKAQEGS